MTTLSTPETGGRRPGRPARRLPDLGGGDHHPAVVAELRERTENSQLRLADRITAFAGSMWFVYLHAVLFAIWMLVFEESPWPTLTLIVSLEAIFLSTFVMIGQNRQAAFQQAKADSDYASVDRLLEENTRLTREVHRLTAEVHRVVTERPAPER
jgi:uncharacterized membrane protein